jgi:Pentapeptide repeats (8 copies)
VEHHPQVKRRPQVSLWTARTILARVFSVQAWPIDRSGPETDLPRTDLPRTDLPRTDLHCADLHCADLLAPHRGIAGSLLWWRPLPQC